MKCLVIIDMQRYFDAADELWLIRNIINKIKDCIDRNEPIIILEYVDDDDDLGGTVSEILDAIYGYKNCFFSYKEQNDGGDEIDSVIKEQDLDVQEFVVCGVNLNACVMDTVVSISWDYPNVPINVPLNCVNSSIDQKEAELDFEDEMESFDRYNVALVAC